MKTYKLKSGFAHTHGDKELLPGEEVELTEDQAKSFSDRFTLVGSENDKESEEEIPILNPEGENQGPPKI